MGLLSAIADKVKSWLGADPQTETKLAPATTNPIPVQEAKPINKVSQGDPTQLIDKVIANPKLLDALIIKNPRAQVIKDLIQNHPEKLQALKAQLNPAQTNQEIQTSSFDASQFASPRIQLVDDSGPGSMPRTIELKLDNGIRVLVVPDESASKVHLRSFYSVGSNQDVIPGTAHVLEHIASGAAATTSFAKGEISDLYEFNGAKIDDDWNAGTGHDLTTYWASLDPNLLELLMKIESERMDQLNLDDIDDILNREKSLIYSELDFVNDNPYRKIDEGLRSIAMPDSIYNNNQIGTKESVAKITKQDLQDFYRYYQDPENLTLVLSGNLGSPQRLEHLLLTYFGSKSKPADAPVKAEEKPKRPQTSPAQRELTILKPGDDKVLALAYFGPNVTERDACVMHFIFEALAGRGTKSRLAKKLVEAKNINAELGCSSVPTTGDSLNVFSVKVDKIVDLDELKQEVKKVLEEVKTNGLDPEELDKLKLDSLYSQIDKQEDPNQQAEDLADNHVHGDWRSEANAVKIAQSITNDDIKRVAASVLTDDNQYVVYLKPSGEAKAKKVETDLDRALEVKQIDAQRLANLTEALSGRKGPSLPKLNLQELGQVLINEDHHLPKVAIAMESQGQPLNAKERVIASMLSSLFERSGTMQHDCDQLQEMREDLGMSFSFGVGHDGASFGLDFVSTGDNLSKALNYFRERVLEARLDPETFAGIKGACKEAIKKENESPSQILYNQVMNKAFPPDHYHHMASQVDRWKLVNSINYADVIRFWEKIKQSQFNISASGDININQVSQLQTVLKDWASQVPRNLGEDLMTAHTADVQQLEGNEYKALQDQSYVSFAQRVNLRNTDPDYYAVKLAKDILAGQNKSSRLFRTIRESQGNVYGINGALFNFRNADGFFVIDAASQKGNGKNLALQIRKVLNNFAGDITEEELKMVKQNFLNSYMKDEFTDNASTAGSLLELKMQGRNFDFVKNLPQMIENITLDDVKNAMKKHLDLKNIHEVIVDDKVYVDGQEVDTKFDAKAYKAQNLPQRDIQTVPQVTVAA